MHKTGVDILQLFSLLAMILPVIPLFIIFYKKLYTLPSIQLLTASLLFWLASAILLFASNDAAQQQLIREIARGCDCTLLLLIYRVTATNKRVADTFNFLVISSVSIILAIYVTTGVERYTHIIKFVQSLLMIGATLLAFSQLVARRDILLFESTLFWIGAATFFTYSMLLLIDQIGSSNIQRVTEDKLILAYLVLFVKYLFYVITAVITHKHHGNITS